VKQEKGKVDLDIRTEKKMTKQHKKNEGVFGIIFFEHFLVMECKIDIVESFSSDISEKKNESYM